VNKPLILEKSAFERLSPVAIAGQAAFLDHGIYAHELASPN